MRSGRNCFRMPARRRPPPYSPCLPTRDCLNWIRAISQDMSARALMNFTQAFQRIREVELEMRRLYSLRRRARDLPSPSTDRSQRSTRHRFANITALIAGSITAAIEHEISSMRQTWRVIDVEDFTSTDRSTILKTHDIHGPMGCRLQIQCPGETTYERRLSRAPRLVCDRCRCTSSPAANERTRLIYAGM